MVLVECMIAQVEGPEAKGTPYVSQRNCDAIVDHGVVRFAARFRPIALVLSSLGYCTKS